MRLLIQSECHLIGRIGSQSEEVSVLGIHCYWLRDESVSPREAPGCILTIRVDTRIHQMSEPSKHVQYPVALATRNGLYSLQIAPPFTESIT